MSQQNFIQEWTVLQNQYDAYERSSLVIKLFAIALFTVLWLMQSIGFVMVAVLLAVWFLDAIWKTFQSRIEARLLVVETSISENVEKGALQFNREFARNRPGITQLPAEYLKQAVRPTIAFPHALLVVITLVFLVFFPEQSPWDVLNGGPEFNLFN